MLKPTIAVKVKSLLRFFLKLAKTSWFKSMLKYILGLAYPSGIPAECMAKLLVL